MTGPDKLLFIFGTRPEAIKLSPLILAFRESKHVDVKVCVTAQHREMLDQVLSFFEIQPDYDLDIMKPNQSLFEVTADGLKALEPVLTEYHPQLIFTQGDTTTAFIGTLAAYYKRIRVAHVEAGLRSGNKYAPYPEEINRILADHLSDIHFAPTSRSKSNLEKENCRGAIHIVGNTVIDALFLGLKLIQKRGDLPYRNFFRSVDFSRKIVLITGHRRESFGKPFEEICEAIRTCAEKFTDVEFVYPVHLNPQVQEPVRKILSALKNVKLMDPLNYEHFIWLMNNSYVVLTDSGGLQEEAPALGKPVLVMRDVTERLEGIEAGTSKLVGTDKKKIIDELSLLLSDASAYEQMAKAVNPYGDGTAGKQIVDIISKLEF